MRGGGGGEVGGSHMKRSGMLIVSLGVFWKKKNLAVKVSFRVAFEEILKNYIFSIRFIYSINVIKV